MSRALQLNKTERAHLVDLVRPAETERPPVDARDAKVRPSLQRIVDAMAGFPAFIRNWRLDILYADPLAAALYSEQFSDPVQPPELVAFRLLAPRARTSTSTGTRRPMTIAASLRGEAGRNPFDPILSDRVGLLSTRSDEFRANWASHDVFVHRSGTKRLRHPLVGDLTLA